MECHDGVTAPESASATSWNRGPGSLGDLRRNHPVGVRYEQRPVRGAAVRLRPASSLPATARLPNGRISCTSCHNLYARDDHKLTVPNEGSALCFTCHDMD